MIARRFWLLSIALVMLSSGRSFACNSINPHPQSLTRFYDYDRFGQFGLEVNSQNLWMIDKNECYNIISLRNRSDLVFYFNNKIREGRAPELTYLGVIVIRRYPVKAESEASKTLYLFRNRTDENSKGNWGASSKGIDVSRGNWIESADVDLQDEGYDPENGVDIDGFDLDAIFRQSTDDFIKDWHSNVLYKNSDRYFVSYNTKASAGEWNVDLAGEGAGEFKYLARAYLLKYQESIQPSHSPFLYVGSQGADCIYLKLIRPGGRGPILGRGRYDRGDFVTLVQDPRSRC